MPGRARNRGGAGPARAEDERFPMTTIETTARDEQGGLPPELRDMLAVLGEAGEGLHWKIAAFEGGGDLSSLGYTMLGLEGEISSYPQGMPISWELLWKLSERIEQALEISLAGSKTPDFDFDVRSDEFETLDVVLQLQDGWIWRVTSSSEVLIQKYASSFSGAHIENG